MKAACDADRIPLATGYFAADGKGSSATWRNRHYYYVAPERDGLLTAHVHFEMPAGDGAHAIPVATGPAATQRITLELDQGGWEFTSPMAVQALRTAGLGEGRSGATLVLAPQGSSLSS